MSGSAAIANNASWSSALRGAQADEGAGEAVLEIEWDAAAGGNSCCG